MVAGSILQPPLMLYNALDYQIFLRYTYHLNPTKTQPQGQKCLIASTRSSPNEHLPKLLQ
jgi:hypothetical protein